MVAVNNSVNYDRPGECSPEKVCFVMALTDVSAQVVDTSVNVFFIRTSNFAAEAEPKLNVLIFFTF